MTAGLDVVAATWPIWFGLVAYAGYHVYDGLRSEDSSTSPSKEES